VATVGVAFDRDDEGGEVAVADDASKLPFGLELSFSSSFALQRSMCFATRLVMVWLCEAV
jgi:hypothetical protein